MRLCARHGPPDERSTIVTFTGTHAQPVHPCSRNMHLDGAHAVVVAVDSGQAGSARCLLFPFSASAPCMYPSNTDHVQARVPCAAHAPAPGLLSRLHHAPPAWHRWPGHPHPGATDIICTLACMAPRVSYASTSVSPPSFCRHEMGGPLQSPDKAPALLRARVVAWLHDFRQELAGRCSCGSCPLVACWLLGHALVL